jgi:imidazolonepropionase-like amidohydrolase
MTLPQEQLKAACDEAKKQGRRTLVHAYKEAVRGATLAGCTEVEHGTLAPDDDLKLMAEEGTYFDPQCGLVIENYLQNRERYLGTPGYTAEGFAAMEKILPMDREIVEHATKTSELKVVFGTDAVAGAHGRNAEEFIGPGQGSMLRDQRPEISRSGKSAAQDPHRNARRHGSGALLRVEGRPRARSLLVR